MRTASLMRRGAEPLPRCGKSAAKPAVRVYSVWREAEDLPKQSEMFDW